MNLHPLSRVSRAGLAVFALCILATDASAETNWSGFYGGLALGGAYSAAKPDNGVIYSGYFTDDGGASDREQLTPILNETIEGFDVTGSALFGYDYQDRNVIYGIEGDLTFMPFSESENHGRTTYDTSPANSFTSRTSVESDFSFSIRPKIGYATGGWQIYFAAGPSISRFKTTHEFTDTFGTGTNHTFTDTKTAFGVSSSIGAGFSFGNDWTLRGDYVFTYFPQIVNSDANIGQGGPAPDLSYDGDFQSHNIRFAVIKRF
ncbi:outer membrane protein [Thalassospira lucentensis]|uniref:outer membrane protein n=1 Tax=Thalassospira lucentensis TaxID=168935 RepID=UPI003D277300